MKWKFSLLLMPLALSQFASAQESGTAAGARHITLREAVQSGELSDTDIETRIAEMKASRAARDFKKSDAIRTDLTEAGILVEITKDGIRWRRK